jgi:hypothetical protein
MLKQIRIVGTAAAVFAMLMAVSACQKPEGPAERAGKDLDKAVDRAGQKIETMGENIQDTAKGNKTDDTKK